LEPKEKKGKKPVNLFPSLGPVGKGKKVFGFCRPVLSVRVCISQFGFYVFRPVNQKGDGVI